MDARRILVVDDEHRQLDILRAILVREGLEVETAATGEAAAAMLADDPPDVLLTDLKLPGLDGIALLRVAQAQSPRTVVIIVTAHGAVDTAVQAMKLGAFDYLTKPLARDTVVLAVQRALERARLLSENQALTEQLVDRFSLPNVIGDHGKMQDVFRLVRKVAASPSTVLIYGESGTGKELIARAIHYGSPRAHRPFLAINCAAIPEPLLESELFGHEKGAFTGASARRVGLFEQASGSTLLLDEIGDLGLAMQAKILRVIQEKEIRRVGGDASIPVDVRIVAATNKNLARMMRDGKFREDLYYRLNVVSLTLPPLRERTTDIPRLIDHFIARHAAAAGKAITGVDDRALAALMQYRWPGNVRQLESAIERAVLLADGPRLSLDDLPQEVRGGVDGGALGLEIPDAGISFERVEKEILEQALRKGRNISAAARLLGMTRRTLQYRLKKFGLSAGEGQAPAPDGAEAAPDRPS